MEYIRQSCLRVSVIHRKCVHRLPSCPGNCKRTSTTIASPDNRKTLAHRKVKIAVGDTSGGELSRYASGRSESVSVPFLRSLEKALGECETLPRSEDGPPVERARLPEKEEEEVEPTPSEAQEEAGPHRFNALNIQLLPAALHRHLFGGGAPPATPERARAVESARAELRRRGLLRERPAPLADPGLRLPRLRGADVEEHFLALGEEQAGPYRALLQRLAAAGPPPPPATWLLRAGWTRYAPGEAPRAVAFPDADALVLDVEVCRAAGEAPTLATAAAPDAWFCWVAPRLAAASADGPAAAPPRKYSSDDFLPLESAPPSGAFAPGLRERPRVVVGHNVAYDRARVREQYWPERSALRFVDTMSLHVCVGGLASGQRAALRSGAEAAPEDASWRAVAALNSLADVHRLYCGGAPLDKGVRELFVDGRGLGEVRAAFQSAAAYCAEDVAATWRVLARVLPLFLERFPHPVTLAGLLELGGAYLPVGEAWPRFLAAAERAYAELREETRRTLARAADDACALLHADAYASDPWMWDQDWTLQELRLRKGAPKKPKGGEADAEADEDFDPAEWPSKFRALATATRRRLPAKRPLLPGYPAWYRALCERPGDEGWTPGPRNVTTGMQVTPKLLRLTWEGYPLHYVREHGWGFLVPQTMHLQKDKDDKKGHTESEDEEHSSESPLDVPDVEGQPVEEPALDGPLFYAICDVCPKAPTEHKGVEDLDQDLDGDVSGMVEGVRREVQDRLGWGSRRGGVDGTQAAAPSWYRGAGVRSGASVGACWFLKLPHKDGGAARVGSPLARDFEGALEAGTLAGAGAGAARVLDAARQMSYWRNNRERVLGQLVGWLPAPALPHKLRPMAGRLGAVLPQVVAAGTLTRRAVEPTWMTAANARPGLLGSELRALVHAPPGHALVGADVDAQELWIAALLGDAASPARDHGATPFGWMTLRGSKAHATDMHSVTAAAAGVTRDQAKVLNYARIYGAGPRFAARLLQRFDPSLGDGEARARAARMFALTKGRRVWRARPEWQGLAPTARSAAEARRAAHALGATDLRDVYAPPRWEGGTESDMFNRLEEIANAPKPCTPFLGGRLSRALEAAAEAAEAGADDRFLPTRVNWVVQSGAVDFLHLMLVSMRWLQPRARFCLSFHDEVRYLVSERERHRAALALHATNLLARAFCARRLGLLDLPAAVAFFASVEVDAALRKDARHDCATPSNPHGLRRGYGVPPGEALDVYEAVARAGRGALAAAGKGKAKAKAKAKAAAPRSS